MATLDSLGQMKVPATFAKLQAKGLTDTMNILRAAQTSDGAGGTRYGEAEAVNAAPISCICQPKLRVRKDLESERIISVMQYEIMFPTNQDDERIDIEPSTDRLQVIARGNETERIYKIVGLKNESGVILTAVCELDN